MADFPALHPDEVSYSMPQYASSSREWVDGSVTRHNYSSKPDGPTLRLRWRSPTSAERQQIEDHYRGQQGITLPFGLPATIGCGNTFFSNVDTPTTQWRYIAVPTPQDSSAGQGEIEVVLGGEDTAVETVPNIFEAETATALEATVGEGYVVPTRIPDPTSVVTERFAEPQILGTGICYPGLVDLTDPSRTAQITATVRYRTLQFSDPGGVDTCTPLPSATTEYTAQVTASAVGLQGVCLVYAEDPSGIAAERCGPYGIKRVTTALGAIGTPDAIILSNFDGVQLVEVTDWVYTLI